MENNRCVESIWVSYQILPIISSMLPSLPKKRPMFDTRPSCEVDMPVSVALSSTSGVQSVSHVETYDYDENLWAEMDELDTGVYVNELNDDVEFESVIDK